MKEDKARSLIFTRRAALLGGVKVLLLSTLVGRMYQLQIVESERVIYREQAAASGKPPAVVEKIVDGKLEKFFADTCLVEQPFIKDPDKTIQQLITETVARLGENVVVRRFARFQLGEQSQVPGER